MTDEEAADRLDAEITAALRGEAKATTDPTVLWLATTIGATPPQRTYRRIAKAVVRKRRWVPAQLAAGVLAVLMLWHGLSNILFGEWIARALGEPFNAHVSLEGGTAYLAVGTALVACALNARLIPVAVAVGVPLGLSLGLHGIREINQFAWGAVFHLAEGTAAIVLLVTWLLMWRYSRRRGAEEGV